MKSNFNFFVGIFAVVLISWLGVVMGANAQLGSLPPYYDDVDGATHPEWMPGIAARGQLVYRDLGCAACHTQQVRRASLGSDQARGWGDRQSVARDYIYQPAPQLGSNRVGPDLTNLADRKPSAPDADDLLNLLYTGADGMPSYKFLFEMRHIGADAQPSDNALKLTGSLRPHDGWEVVPTRRAEALVGYLVNLKTTYTYPEARPYIAPAAEGAKAPAAAPAAPAGEAPAPGPANPAPSAAAPASAAPSPAETPAGTAPAAATPALSAAPAAAPGPASAASPSPSPTGTATPSPTSSGGSK